MNMTAKVVILLIGDKMAQRQNTFNQFPSNDLADLNDNTMAVDEFANSQNDYALDRFGRKFTTLHKIIADINKISDEIRVGALPATRSVVNGTPIYTVGAHVVTNDNIGEFRLMPFRANELPFGWYFRNGDNYLLHSPQGQALNRLSDNYKRDHQITIKDINGHQYINVPSAFTPDGRGYFERPANGTARQVGSVEDDAIRNIKGSLPNGSGRAVIGHENITKGEHDGAMSVYHCDDDWLQVGSRRMRWAFFDFDASRVVPTAHENRPVNIGMTPVIYLGV